MDFSLLGEAVHSKIIISILLVAAAIILYNFAKKTIIRRVERPEVRRRWIVNHRNAVVFLVIVGLLGIWGEALRTLALSVVALAVAFTIATKELIQSILGSLLKTATNAFSLGDRIEIGDRRGDVIDHTLFTTTIMEVGPGRSFHLRTGRIITFPNNKLLDTYVVNESYNKQYVIHVFSVPVKVDQDWRKAEKILLEAAREECADYLDFARQSMKLLEETHGLDGLPVQPRINIQVAEPSRLNLLVRVPAPVGRQGRVEQAIVRKFLAQFYGQTEAEEPKPVPEDVERPKGKRESPQTSEFIF